MKHLLMGPNVVKDIKKKIETGEGAEITAKPAVIANSQLIDRVFYNPHRDVYTVEYTDGYTRTRNLRDREGNLTYQMAKPVREFVQENKDRLVIVLK